MAHSSDGQPAFSSFPDYSTNNSAFSTAGDLRFYTQSLLESKEKQLQQVGVLGQQVLAQQAELERRITELQGYEGEDDEAHPELYEKYHELAETIIRWDEENAQLSSAFGQSKVRSLLDALTHQQAYLFSFSAGRMGSTELRETL